MYPRRFTLDPSTRLREGFDLERRLALLPRHHTAKGMFFPAVTRHLAPGEYDALRPALCAPPRGDKYLPFGDYPLVDLCLFDATAARKLFPHEALGEGLRRLARHDLDVFRATRIGRVMLALVHDAASALLLLPTVVGRVQRGGTVRAERRGDAVGLSVREMPYWLEGGVFGTLEGIVTHFGGAPRITVDRRSDGDAEVEIELGPLSSAPPSRGSGGAH